MKMPLSTACIAALSGVILLSCQQPSLISSGTTIAPLPSTPIHGAWSAPELVTIQGYSGTAQDPFLTSDNKYLLWDTHTDSPTSPVTSIYYARQVDYQTFAYVGKIHVVGLMDNDGQAAPATDDAGNFYFMTQKYSPQTTVARGVFVDGTVTGMAPVIGITPPGSGSGNMSAIPSRDGHLLVFSDNISGPRPSQIAMAQKNADGTFTRLSNSAELLSSVNAISPIAYEPNLSTDELEIFFTAPPSNYMARRNSATEAFGLPEVLNTGTPAESLHPSRDGSHLYFHKIDNPNHAIIYVMSRQ